MIFKILWPYIDLFAALEKWARDPLKLICEARKKEWPYNQPLVWPYNHPPVISFTVVTSFTALTILTRKKNLQFTY